MSETAGEDDVARLRSEVGWLRAVVRCACDIIITTDHEGRVTECSDTANGSANTATSSGIESGTLWSIESCAGMSSAYPPLMSRHVPMWIPGEIGPAAKLQHRL